MKEPIKTPMYFAKGFIEGAEKRLPEVDGDIQKATQRTTQFLKSTGEKIKKLEEVRKANYQDPTQTEEAKAVNTWQYAKAKQKEVQEIANTLPDLTSYADGIRKTVDNELKEAADTNFGREARQRMAEMSEKERSEFISKQMSNGDYQTPAYVLGAPAYLSGMPEKAHAKLKERYVNDFYPHETALVKSLTELHQHAQKGIKSYDSLMRKVHASASIGGALDKAEKAKNLMNQ